MFKATEYLDQAIVTLFAEKIVRGVVLFCPFAISQVDTINQSDKVPGAMRRSRIRFCKPFFSVDRITK